MRRLLLLTALLLLCLGHWPLAAQMRILGIGNSFTLDLMDQVPALLEGDTTRVELAFLYKSSATLNDHVANLRSSNRREYTFYHYNNGLQRWDTVSTDLRSVLKLHEWDQIVLHQASYHAGVYSTIKDDLKALSDTLLALQPQAKLAWQLTWAYAKNADIKEFSIYDHSQAEMLYRIKDVSARVMHDSLRYHISTLIPSGIVIQKLRSSSLEDQQTDFCVDGRHIDPELGRYALACTFYQSLLADYLGSSVLDTNWHPATRKAYSEADFELVRQTAYDFCSNADAIWLGYLPDAIYRADYFSIRGRRLYHLDQLPMFIEYDYYESGRKHGRVIYIKE